MYPFLLLLGLLRGLLLPLLPLALQLLTVLLTQVEGLLIEAKALGPQTLLYCQCLIQTLGDHFHSIFHCSDSLFVSSC